MEINHHGCPLAFAGDLEIIEKIAARAWPMAIKANIEAPLGFWVPHIAVCHSVCPLDFEALYTAPDAEFAADVFGIRAYMHESGQWFTDWRPRYCKEPHGALESRILYGSGIGQPVGILKTEKKED